MKLQKKQIRKIGIFRALQLGDMLCAVPAVRALRTAFPEAEIFLIGLPWAKSFSERFHSLFNGFISFPGYPGLPEQPFDPALFEAFLTEVRSLNLDLLLQMQGNGTIVNPMLQQFGAGLLAGFHNDESRMDNTFFMDYPDFGPEKQRHLQLMQYLGIPAQGDELEFPITPEDQQDHDSLLLPLAPGSYIVFHPGSRGSWRQLPPQYFAVLADFARKEGFQIVVTGTAAESAITSEMLKCMRYLPINLTGKTSLGAIGIVIRDAFALVSNCTGVSHMADALKTPSLIFSMDGEPERWSPSNHRVHRMIDWLRNPSFKDALLSAEELLKYLRDKSPVV